MCTHQPPSPPQLPQTSAKLSAGKLPPTGLLLINKHAGPTSHEIVDLARRALQFRKIGHCGTLDPFASGLLILLIGEATRLQHYFLSMNKTYRAGFSFGTTTDTLDPTGIVTATDPTFTLPPLAEVETIIADQFSGTIEQLPPRYSAVKVDGKRAYKLARQQQPFTLKPKTVTIHDFTVTQTSPTALTAQITCGSGTYVRALVRDLAKALGTHGTLAWLQRTQIEPFHIHQALPAVSALSATATPPLHTQLQPVHQYIQNTQNIDLDERGVSMLKQGSLIPLLKRGRQRPPPASPPKLAAVPPALNADYLLFFYHHSLVGIWEQKRNALIYNTAKHF